MPQPRPGLLDAAQQLMVDVPGGQVNAYGGNLYIERKDLTLDTRVGQWTVGAVW
ncbi:MAG: hypothetical protein GY733_19370, partial [bacterium]|nr:hypothetical protein [bacterium]